MLFLMLLLTTMKKSDALETITARSGDSVQMTSQRLREARLEPGWDVRWTHPHLVMSLKSNARVCHHQRCRLESDGSLLFSHVQSQDAGYYRVEVFLANGKHQLNDTVQLVVEEAGHNKGGSSAFVCLPIFILLILIVVFIILRRRRSQSARSTDPLQENVYVVMHGHRGNKMKNEEEKQGREEESYVACSPVVSMETQTTAQKSAEEEDIYV